MRKKGSPEELQRLRLVAANMIDKMMKPSEIASLLDVDDQTVRRWRRMYREGGRDALLMHKGGGRPVKLTGEQKQQLVEMLKAEPKTYGFDAYLWTTKLIARLILEKFGVSYYHDHVGVILHQLGWSPQIPARRAKERDEAKIAEFREKTWPELEKKSNEEGGTVVFADEVGFMMNPCVKATWAPVGETPVVPFRNRNHKKVSALGAIALAADKTLSVLIDWYPGSYVRGPECLAFAQRLLKEIPDGPIDLVWDNLSAHKSKLIKEWLADNPRLRIHYLPPYAPDLNPIETLWSTVKYHRMANHAIDDLNVLESEAKRHVAAVAAEQRLLEACFRSAELALTLPRAQ